MFTFDTTEIFNTDDVNKLWDAYEEVCARLATIKTLNQDIPDEIKKLKQDIVNKIKKLEKNEH